MDKNKKIMIGLGAAVLFCLCAVGVAVFAFNALGNKFSEAIVTDPSQVSTVAEGIVKYDLPPGYSEQMAMDLGLYQIVAIGPVNDSTKPTIMLMGYGQSLGTDTEQMQEQLQKSFEQQTGQPGMTWTTVEERTMTIRGQDVKVVIREAKSDSGYAMRQMVAAFEGQNGTVILMIQGDASGWDQELIDDFITSIR